MSNMKQISLGEFLSREHGLKKAVISTTTTTFISELDRLDSNYDTESSEWCLIGVDEANGKINQLSGRVNTLENVTQQLIARINTLEQKSLEAVESQLKTIMPPRKAILPSNAKQIAYKCSRFKKRNFGKMNPGGNSFQKSLLIQRQKILKKKNNTKMIKKNINKVNDINNNKFIRNLFQQELAIRVQNPCLKESWHILKARKVEDPHAIPLMKLRKEMMSVKTRLKRVPAPDCKTIIVLD
eukprot:949204_1